MNSTTAWTPITPTCSTSRPTWWKQAEPDLKHTTAINITLADGRPCTIRIEPAMMNRLMSCLSIDEIHQLATTIARSVENPDNRPLCHT